MSNSKVVPVAPTGVKWLIDRLHRRAKGVTEEPPLPVLLEAAAIELENRIKWGIAAAPTPEQSEVMTSQQKITKDARIEQLMDSARENPCFFLHVYDDENRIRELKAQHERLRVVALEAATYLGTPPSRAPEKRLAVKLLKALEQTNE